MGFEDTDLAWFGWGSWRVGCGAGGGVGVYRGAFRENGTGHCAEGIRSRRVDLVACRERRVHGRLLLPPHVQREWYKISSCMGMMHCFTGAVECINALWDYDNKGGADQHAHADCRDELQAGLGEGKGERERACEEGTRRRQSCFN